MLFRIFLFIIDDISVYVHFCKFTLVPKYEIFICDYYGKFEHL